MKHSCSCLVYSITYKVDLTLRLFKTSFAISVCPASFQLAWSTLLGPFRRHQTISFRLKDFVYEGCSYQQSNFKVIVRKHCTLTLLGIEYKRRSNLLLQLQGFEGLSQNRPELGDLGKRAVQKKRKSFLCHVPLFIVKQCGFMFDSVGETFKGDRDFNRKLLRQSGSQGRLIDVVQWIIFISLWMRAVKWKIPSSTFIQCCYLVRNI